MPLMRFVRLSVFNLKRKERAMKDKSHNQQSKNSNKQTHTVYVVKEQGDKTRWVRVGAAWEHSDHEGMNQIISLLDMDVTLTVRRNKEKEQ